MLSSFSSFTTYQPLCTCNLLKNWFITSLTWCRMYSSIMWNNFHIVFIRKYGCGDTKITKKIYINMMIYFHRICFFLLYIIHNILCTNSTTPLPKIIIKKDGVAEKYDENLKIGIILKFSLCHGLMFVLSE